MAEKILLKAQRTMTPRGPVMVIEMPGDETATWRWFLVKIPNRRFVQLVWDGERFGENSEYESLHRRCHPGDIELAIDLVRSM